MLMLFSAQATAVEAIGPFSLAEEQGRFTLTPTQVWQWSYYVQKSNANLYEYIASSIVLPKSRVGNKVPGGSSRPAYPHRFPGVAI